MTIIRKKITMALLTTIVAGALTLTPALSDRVPGAHASPPPPHILVGQTPDVVMQGRAVLRGHHDPTALLHLNIGLGVHDSAALDEAIAAASTPGSPQYGHYLTRAQYLAQFAPTDAEVADVRAWATSAGLQVNSVSPDHLLVGVQGTTAQIERALSVQLSDYRLGTRTFLANDRDATVPNGLDVRAISGLTTIKQFHMFQTRPLTQGRALSRIRPHDLRDCDGQGCYSPQDFRAAYNVDPVGDGGGQTIGFTLWGQPLGQDDLTRYASDTGTTALTVGKPGADGIDFFSVDGPSTDTSSYGEIALDIENGHGVASGSHLTYLLAATNPATCQAEPDGTQGCQPTTVGLEDAVSAAANDTSLHVVSNSWGGGEATSADDPDVANTNASLQLAASVGTTFYFSSGDKGFLSGATQNGCDPSNDPNECQGQGLPSFPADSPYVVAVGGTNLVTNGDGSYNSETVWGNTDDGSGGGGCSTVFARPAWQTGVGQGAPTGATCAGRAIPDVAADADPASGAYVVYAGNHNVIGGTSLAAPLWAGMAADVNRYLSARGQPLMGFSAPSIYQLANNPTTDARDFHDVTSGNNDPAHGSHGYDPGVGLGLAQSGQLRLRLRWRRVVAN